MSWWVRWLVIAGVASAFGGWCYVKGLNHARDASEHEKAVAQADAFHIVTKHEVRYVERVEKVNVPVTVVRDRLVVGVCGDARGPVSGQPSVAAPAGQHADAGFADRLGADLIANRKNKIQCEEVMGAVRDINARHR